MTLSTVSAALCFDQNDENMASVVVEVRGSGASGNVSTGDGRYTKGRHAEQILMEKYTTRLKKEPATLIVSLIPCPSCASAIVHAVRDRNLLIHTIIFCQADGVNQRGLDILLRELETVVHIPWVSTHFFRFFPGISILVNFPSLTYVCMPTRLKDG